jgi:hypothetical protein
MIVARAELGMVMRHELIISSVNIIDAGALWTSV